jgi:hypothetical protein
MRQNQYIFVFTATTVIFLPLGFVTVRNFLNSITFVVSLLLVQSVSGMHLFDTTDPGVVAARPKFYITIFFLSLGTYVVAGLAYWLVRHRKEVARTARYSRNHQSQTIQRIVRPHSPYSTATGRRPLPVHRRYRPMLLNHCGINLHLFGGERITAHKILQKMYPFE